MNATATKCVFAGILLAGGAVFANDPPRKRAAAAKAVKADEGASLMVAMEKLAAPGESHKRLRAEVGTWTAKIRSWMGAGPPVESTGISVVKSIFDGRFIEEDYTATVMGKPFSGHGIVGYDNARKKFVSAWVDSMGTGIMLSEGTADASGQTITSDATHMNPLTGQPQLVRTVDRIASDTERVVEFFDQEADGKETRVMEIIYTKSRQ